MAWSTLLTAIATAALVGIAWYAAVQALGQLKVTAGAADLTRKIAEADLKRRRAESSLAALRRYMAVHDEQHPIIVTEARMKTSERRAEAGQGEHVETFKVAEIFELPTPPEVALNAAGAILNALEEVAVGVRLNVYDEYIIFHGARKSLTQVRNQLRDYIKRVHEGRLPHRPAQPSAYEHVLWLVDERMPEIEKEGAPTKLAGALEDELA